MPFPSRIAASPIPDRSRIIGDEIAPALKITSPLTAMSCEASGLPAELSERLARVTVAGAGELLWQSDAAASTLRENVTSPGGTTFEALQVLMADDAWQLLMDCAIAAATARSKELAG